MRSPWAKGLEESKCASASSIFPPITASIPANWHASLRPAASSSLFVCEHTHIPVSRRTPFFGGGDLPKRYAHTHDPFVALSFAAAATHKLVLVRASAWLSNTIPS